MKFDTHDLWVCIVEFQNNQKEPNSMHNFGIGKWYLFPTISVIPKSPGPTDLTER